MVLRRNPNMVTRVIEDETILLPILKSSEEINCIYTLNGSASRIWELINGKRTLKEIKDRVVEEFDTKSKDMDLELTKLLQELGEIKAIVSSSDKSSKIKKSKKSS